jgi:hypothetical protein
MLESCENRLFVRIDVTFRELTSYYSSEAISTFKDPLDTGGMRQDGDNSSDDERRMVTVDGVGCPIREDLTMVEPKKEDSVVVELEVNDSTVVEPDVERNESKGDRTQAQRESRYGEVYMRRKKQNEGVVPIIPLVPSPLPLPTPTLETHYPPQTQNT